MMNQEDIKVFNVNECIKTFRKSYKVQKKMKATIINYIFNIYIVIKKNKGQIDKRNIDELIMNNTINTNKEDNNDLQNSRIQLDSNGLYLLLYYIKKIPEKYKLESKNTNTTTNSSSSITNNVDSSNILQIENMDYHLLSYQNEDITTKNTTKDKLIESKLVKSQCMGRTAKHTRCSRCSKNDSEYCQSHINNKCPYGRFDEELKEPEEKVIKKRGRKRKVEISEKFKNPDYETMWSEIVDGDKRLLDRYNNIYTFDLVSPRFLGIKQLNGKVITSKVILTSVF